MSSLPKLFTIENNAMKGVFFFFFSVVLGKFRGGCLSVRTSNFQELIWEEVKKVPSFPFSL